jgi:hypothetical protein
MKLSMKKFVLISAMVMLVFGIGNAWALEDYTWPTESTPDTCCGVISDLAATAGNGQVTLNWTADAASDGYAVFYTDGTFTVAQIDAQNVTTTDTTYTMTGLTNGTIYQFKIRNYAGSGLSFKIQTFSNVAEATPTAITETTTATATTTVAVTTTTAATTETTTAAATETTTAAATETTTATATTTVPALPDCTTLEGYKSRMDVDGNGEINALDAALIIRYLKEGCATSQ